MAIYMMLAYYIKPWSSISHRSLTVLAQTRTTNYRIPCKQVTVGWLGSRVVSVLYSGAVGPWFKLQSGNSLRQTVHTHRASVHQAAKLVAALLRAAGVTAGLAESNGSLPPGLWLTSPAGWLPRTGISSVTLHSVWATSTFLKVTVTYFAWFGLASFILT